MSDVIATEFLPKALCKVCGLEKIKVYVKLHKGGTCHYTNELGSSWHGRCCPDCRRVYKKEKYGLKKPVGI